MDITTAPEVKTPVPTQDVPLKLDLFKARMETGYDVPTIFAGLKYNDQLIPMKTPDAYWGSYKDKFKGREDFDKFYTDTFKGYDDIQSSIAQKKTLLVGSEKFGMWQESPYYGSNYHQAINNQADFFSPLAVRDFTHVETPSQNAARKGYHVIPEYKEQPDGTLKQVGEKKVAGNVPKWNKLDGNFYVAKESPDSNEFVYKTFDDSKPHYNLERATIWGDQKLYGKSILDPVLGFLSNSTADLLQSVGQTVRIAQDAVGYSADKKNYEKFLETDPITGMFDKMISDMEGLKHKPSAEVAQEQFFGSGLHGFMYQIGLGLGYIVPQRLVAGGIMKMAPKISKEVLRNISTIVGTSQPVNQFYRSAREAGIDEENSAYLALFSMPAVYVTEYALNSKWLTKGLGEDARGQVTDVLRKTTKEFVEEQGKDIASTATKVGILKKTWQKLLTDKSFTEALKGNGSKVIELAGSSIREGTQEGSEEVWYSILERAYDKGFFHDAGVTDVPGKTIGQGLFGNDGIASKTQLNRYWQNALGGFILGGVMDATLLGQKDQYKDYIIEQMILEGQTDKLLKIIEEDFSNGKLGLQHKDINGNIITVDETGKSQGQVFEVPEDVVINNKKIFSKGQVLSDLNGLAYYQTVQTIAEKNEIINRTGLNNPLLVREFSGQESLLRGALDIFKQIEVTRAKIEDLKKQLALPDANTDDINRQITELTEAIDGKNNDKGVPVGGLNQMWDYYIKPVGTTNKSQAYIDNVKTGIANGIKWNTESEKYEKNPDAFRKLSTQQVRNINNFLAYYRDNRNKIWQQKEGQVVEVTEDELFKSEDTLIKNITKGLEGFVSGKTEEEQLLSVRDAMKSITDLNSSLKQIGIDKRNLDSVSENIKNLADKFTGIVRGLFEESGLEYTAPGQSASQLLLEKNASLEEGQTPLALSGETASYYDLYSAMDEHVSSLVKQLEGKDLNVREQGKYTPIQDQNQLNRLMYHTIRNLERFDGTVMSESLDIDKLINDYDKGVLNIDNLSKSGHLQEFKNHLKMIDQILDYSEAINKAKKDPTVADVLSNDPVTTISDNNVTPGKDIPQQYIPSMREKQNDLNKAIERISRKANIEAQDIAINEQRIRKANVLQKSYLLVKAFEEAGSEFQESGINQKMNALNALHKSIQKNKEQLDDKTLSEISSMVFDIENWIYAKGKTDPDFQKRIIEKVIINSYIGSGIMYRLIKDSELSIYVDSYDNLVSTNSVSFEKMESDLVNTPRAFNNIRHLKATNYFNSLFVVESSAFLNKLNDFKTKFGIVPGVEQMESIRLMVTGILLPQTDAKFIVRGKDGIPYDIRDSEMSMGISPFNAVSIDGGGGVGKSTVISKFGLAIADSLMTVKPDIILTAPTTDLIDNLTEAVKSTSFVNKGEYTHSDFINKLFSGELKVEKGSIILIDESSRIMLDDMVKLSSMAKANNLTIVFLGDSVQATEFDPNGFIPSIAFSQTMGIRASRINTKFRTGIKSIGLVANMTERSIRGNETMERIPFPPVEYNEEHTKGVLYVPNATEVINSWKKDIVSESNDRILIFETRDEAEKFKNELPEDLKKYANNVRYVMKNKNNDLNDAGTIQGMEFKYIYVAINDPGAKIEDDKLIYIRRVLLTAMTRAQLFLTIPTYSDSVGIARKVKTEDIYDQSADIKKENNVRTEQANEYLKNLLSVSKPVPTGGTVVSSNTVVEKKVAEKSEVKTEKTKEDDLDLPLKDKRKGEVVTNIATGEATTILFEHVTVGGEVELVALNDGTMLAGPSALEQLSELYTQGTLEFEERTSAKEVEEEILAVMNKKDDTPFFKRSALEFDKGMRLSGSFIVPIMVNISVANPTDKIIGQREFFKKYGNEYVMGGTFDVVFHPSITLYTRNKDGDYEPRTHYNVLAIEDKDGNVKGVLPAPDTSYGDGKNTETKYFSSQKNVNYSEANRQSNLDQVNFDSDLQNKYHSYLVNLHTDAFEKAKNVKTTIGQVTMDSVRGASVSISDNSFNKPSALDSFITRMEEDGVAFEKRGANYLVVQQHVEGVGIRWYLKGSRLLSGDGVTPIKSTTILIPVTPRQLNVEDKAEIQRSIDSLKELAKTAKGIDFQRALAQSVAMQTLKSNVSKIYADDNANKNVRPEYRGLIEITNNKGNSKYLNVSGTATKGVKYAEVVSRLTKAIDQLTKDSATMKIFAWYPITGGKESVISDLKKLMTPVDRIGYPSYYGVMEFGNTDQGLGNKPLTKRKTRGSFGNKKALTESEIGDQKFGAVNNLNVIWKTKEEGIAYIRTVLGQSFVDEFLSDDPELTGSWGYVQGLKMVLRSQGNFVSEQAFRHEPVHVIIDHLIDRKSQKRLLNAVRKHFGDMNDYEAKEMLARLHQEKVNFKIEYKGLSGIIQRFVNWLGDFLSSLKDYRLVLNDFFNDIDSGKFADKLIPSEVAPNDIRQDLEDTTGISESVSERMKENNRRYSELGKVFGDYDRLQDVSDGVIHTVIMNTAVNNYIDGATSGFVYAIEKARNELFGGDLLKQRYMTLGLIFSKVGPNDVVRMVKNNSFFDHYPEEEKAQMITEDYNLWKLSQGKNFDIIVNHWFPGVSGVTEEYIQEIRRGIDESALRDPDKYNSDIVKAHLRHVEYNDFDNNGNIRESQGVHRTFVDYNIIKGQLIEAITRSRSISGATDIKAIFTQLTKQANFLKSEYGTMNETRNSILSFLEIFGREYNVSQKKFGSVANRAAGISDPSGSSDKLSHYMFAYHATAIKDHIRQSGLTNKDELLSAVDIKSVLANDLLNAVVSEMNRRKMNFITVLIEYGDGGLQFHRSMYHETNEATMKRHYKGEVEIKFLADDGVYSKDALSRVNGTWTGSGATYDTSLEYIGKKQRGNVIKWDSGTNKWVWFEKDVDDQIKDAEGILNFFGIKAKRGTVRDIFLNPGIKEQFKIGGNELANFLGNMFSSIYAHRQFMDPDTIEAKKFKERIDAFMQDNNLDLTKDDPTDPSFLTDFFPIIDTVSAIQGYIEGKVSPNFVKTVSGESKSNSLLPSALTNTFANESGRNASDKVVEERNRQLDSMSVEEQNNSPMVLKVNGKYEKTDSLLNPDVRFSINNIDQVNGIKFFGNGTEVSDFTEADYLNQMMANFTDGLFLGRQDQLLTFMPDALGDSGVLPAFTVSFGHRHENLVTINTDETGKLSASLNEEVINRNIDLIFKYHHKARLIAINKLYKFYEGKVTLPGTIDQNIALEEQEGVMKSFLMYELFNHFNKDQRNKGDLSNFKSELDRVGLIENRDFILKKGKFVPGNVFDKDYTFSEKNYQDWLQYSGNARTELRDAVFAKRLKLLSNKLNDTQYFSSDPRIKQIQEKKYVSTKTEVFDKKTGKTRYQWKYQWHPIYKALFYGHLIVNNSVSNHVVGNELQYPDVSKKQKINKAYNSSGLNPVIGGGYNLPLTTNVVRISDPVGKFDALGKIFGNTITNKKYDGHEILNPIVGLQLTHSLGGSVTSSMYSDVNIKVFHQSMDFINHVADQNKMAQHVITADEINGEPAGENLLKFMLTGGNGTKENGIDLYEKYLSIKAEGTRVDENGNISSELSFTDAMKKLHDFIKEQDEAGVNIHDNYIGIISYNSSNKSFKGKVNNVPVEDLHNTDDLMIDSRDNTGIYYQLNLNHPVEGGDVARSNQTDALLGLLPNKQTAFLADSINAVLEKKNSDRLERDIAKAGGFKEYLRKIGARGIDQMGRANILGDLFDNSNIDVMLPMLYYSAIEAYVSEVNKGIDPRSAGIKAVQMPIRNKLYTVKDSNGNTFLATALDIKKNKWKKLDDGKELQHYRFLDKSGNDISDTVLKGYQGDYYKDIAKMNKAAKTLAILLNKPQTEKIRAEEDLLTTGDGILSNDGLKGKLKAFITETKKNIAFMSPAQIAVDYLYKAEFGINENESLNEVLTIKTTDGYFNIMGHLKTKLGKDYYSRETRNSEIDKMIKGLFKLDPEFSVREMTDEKEIADYYKGFLDSLIVYGTRVPTPLLSSAFYAEIAFFTPNSKNTVYIPTGKNILDNSDFDIDELSIYFKTLTGLHKMGTVSENNITDKATEEELANTKHEAIIKAFSDVNNIDLLTIPLDPQIFRDVTTKQRAESEYKYNNDIPTSVSNFINSQIGKTMTGRFANGITAISRLMRLAQSNPELTKELGLNDQILKSKVPDYEFIKERTTFIITTMANLLQISVDNAKELVLGYLNINQVSGNIVSALVMSNKTEQEIADFLQIPVVSKVIQHAAETLSANKRTENVLDIIDDNIRKLGEYVRGDSNMRIQERINRLKYGIAEEIKKKDSDIDLTVAIKNEFTDEYDIYDMKSLGAKEYSDEINKILTDTKKIKEEDRNDEIKKRINLLSEKLSNDARLLKIQDQEYVDALTKQLDSLSELREMYFKGTFIWRLTQGFALYRGIQSKDVVRQSMIDNLEFNMNMTLDEYNTGVKSGFSWTDQGRFMLGRNSTSDNFSGIADVSGHVLSIVNAIKTDKKISPANTEFVVGSSIGYESEFARELKKAGFTVTKYMPTGGRTLSQNGISTYDNKENAEFTIDEEARSERHLRIRNSDRADLTVNFDATNNNDNLRGGTNIVNLLSNKRDTAQISETVDKIKSQIRSNKTEEKVKINLTGSSLFAIKTKPKTEHETWDQNEKEIRKYGNIAAIYKLMPNIDSYVKALNNLEKAQEIFYHKSPFIKGMMEDYKNMMAIPRMTSNQRIAFDRAVQKFILDMYFNKLGLNTDLDKFPSVRQTVGATYDKTINFSSYRDREYFVTEFPHTIMALQEESSLDENHPLYNNKFIEALRFGGQRLIFDSSFLDNSLFYRDEFRKIEEKMPELAELLKIYNLLVHGFQFEYGSYRAIIGSDFYEDISKYINKVNRYLTSKKTGETPNKVKQAFAKYFLDNAVIMEDDLRQYYSKVDNALKKLNDEGVYPKYVSDKVFHTYTDASGVTRKKKIGFNRVMRHISNDRYDEIYSNSTNKLKNIPSNRIVESDVPVVRLTDVKDFRNLRSSDSKFTRIGFRYPHSYHNGIVLVNGEYANLNDEGIYEISLKLRNDNPDNDGQSIKRRRANERSVEFFVNNLQSVIGKELKPIYSANRFSMEHGNDAILFNPGMMNPEKNKIADLYLLNAAILEKNNKTLYDSIVEIASKDERYETDSNSKKVADILRDETVTKNKNDIKVLEKARKQIIDQIASSIGVANLEGITFGTVLNDLFDSPGIAPNTKSLLNQISAQYRSNMRQVSDNTAQDIINRLNKQFSTGMQIITETEARTILNEPISEIPNAFYLNGKAYFVSGKIHEDTPIHEVLHPFIHSLFVGNKPLFDNLLDETLKSNYGKETWDWINTKYSDKTIEDRQKELVTQILGEQVARIIPPKQNKGLLGVVERVWNWITNTIRSLFRGSLVASKIDPKTTMGELAQQIAGGAKVLSGSFNELWEQRSNMSSKDLVDDLLIHNVLKNEDGTLKVSSFKQKQEESLQNYIYNEASKTAEKHFTVYSKDDIRTYDMKKQWEEGESSVKKYIRENIVPLMDDEDSVRKTSVYDWLNNTNEIEHGFGRLDATTVHRFFGRRGHTGQMFNYEVLKSMRKLIRHSSATIVMPYSRFANFLDKSNLKDMVDTDLMDRDPMVVVHGIKYDKNGNIDFIDLSILDVNFRSTDYFGDAGKGLFSNYIDDNVAKKKGIQSVNTLDEVRKLQMGFMALKMKEVAGSKVNIRTIGVINMKKDSFTPKLTDITRLVGNIRNLKNIPGFVASLNSKLQTLALNDKIQEPRDYIPDYMEMLRTSLYDELSVSEDKSDKNSISILNNHIDIINDYINKTGTENEIIKMLEYRRWMIERIGLTEEQRNNNEEYWLISEILGNMKGYKRNPLTSMPKMSDAGAWEEWISSIHDIRSTVLQDIYAIMMRSSAEVSGVFDQQFVRKHSELVKKLQHNVLLEKVADVGSKRYDRLFKRKKILGTDGKEYDINLFEIWTERNAENASLNLTDDELAYANFVADNVEKYIKEMYRHQSLMDGDFFTYNDKNERVIDTKGLEEYVNGQYARFWKRGMLPIMPKDTSQQIFSGQIGRGIKRWWDRMANPQETLDEMLELTRDNMSNDIVKSHFMNQYAGVETMGYGSTDRLSRLGLDMIDGVPVVRIAPNSNGSVRNSDLNENIEEIMKYFVMDALWKPKMDTDVLPEYNGALARLNGITALYNLKQTANKRHLTERMQRIVQGKGQLEHESKEWHNVVAGINLVYRMTTFNGVALSIPVAITSGIGNLTELNLLALANEVGNPYNIFGVKEMWRAKLEVMTNSKKVGVIARNYQIMDMERFDLLNNQRWKESTSHAFDARTFHYLNWLTDYSVREVVMVAQMMYDGSYDAHSVDSKGNMKYDAKKDLRFFGKDGKQTKEQKGLMEWVHRNLLKDRRIIDQDKTELPLRGYDLDDQRKFQWIANKFVTGTYSHELTGKFDAFILGKLAMQFKKYLVDKVQVRAGLMKTEAEGGYKQMITDEDGNLREVWIELDTEGAYVTVAKWMYEDVIKPTMKREFKDVKGFKNMSELQKHNFARTTFDALIFVGIYALFTGLKNLTPPDEEKPKYVSLMDMRLITAVKNGWLTALSITPKELISTLGIPVVDQIKRLINIITFNGSASDLRRSLPLKSTIDSFGEIFDYINE